MPDSNRNKIIGMRIRQAREAKGWSQAALADELNTKQATVARWESGSFPKRIGLPRVAEALDQSPEWFQKPLEKSETWVIKPSKDNPFGEDISIASLLNNMSKLQKRIRALESNSYETEIARIKKGNAEIKQQTKDLRHDRPATRQVIWDSWLRAPEEKQALCYYILTENPKALEKFSKSLQIKIRDAVRFLSLESHKATS